MAGDGVGRDGVSWVDASLEPPTGQRMSYHREMLNRTALNPQTPLSCACRPLRGPFTCWPRAADALFASVLFLLTDNLATVKQQLAKAEAERTTLVQRLETMEAALTAERKAAEQRLTEAAARYEKEREHNQANENNLLMQIDQLRQIETNLCKAALEAEKAHQQVSELHSRIQTERDALVAAQSKNASLQTAVDLGKERLTVLTHEIETERKATQNQRARAETAEKSVAMKEAELATKQLVQKEALADMAVVGHWKDRWLTHPFPSMSEPEKAICYLIDYHDYGDDHLAWLYNKASLRAIDALESHDWDGFLYS